MNSARINMKDEILKTPEQGNLKNYEKDKLLEKSFKIASEKEKGERNISLIMDSKQ